MIAGVAVSGGVLFACATDRPVIPETPADAAPPADAGVVEAAPIDAPVPLGPITADLQLLDLSSLRGQLDPMTEVDPNGDTRSYGGLEALAGYFAKDRAQTPATVVLTGGDVAGATPELSAIYDDVPAVSALNLLGAAAATFGPHDFERGDAFLDARMSGSVFRWVSTNVPGIDKALGPRVVLSFLLVDVAQTRVKIAVLGLSEPALASLVPPGALGTATVTDAVAATNAAAVTARAAGAHVVVALAAFGSTGAPFGEPVGPLVDYAKKVSGVDVVLGGRTDQLVNLTIPRDGRSMLVLQNRDRGRTYARVKLHVEAGVVTTSSAEIVEPLAVTSSQLTDPNGKCGGAAQPACRCQGSVTPATDLPCPTGFACDATSGSCNQTAMAPDPAATALLKPFRDGLTAKLDAPLGRVDVSFVRDGAAERAGEVPLGDFVADALRDQYSSAGVRVALVEAATLTSGLPSSYAPADASLRRPGNVASPFDLVAGDGFTAVVPTASCVVRSISGKVLWDVLESSVGAIPSPSPGFLQVSGLLFSYKASNAKGSRVQSVTLSDGHDVPKDDPSLYTVVMTDATSRGDDGYPMLAETLATPGRRLVADVVRDYIARASGGGPNVIAVPAGGRITKIP